MLLPFWDLLSRGLARLLGESGLAASANKARARTRGCVHANDLDVATQQNRAQSVRRIADLLLPQRRPKAHRVIRNKNAKLFRGDHMPHLMKGDRRQNSDNDNDDTDERAHAHISFHWPTRTISRAR